MASLERLREGVAYFKSQWNSAACQSSLRAAGVALATVYIISNLPQWIQRGLHISPILSINIVIIAILFLYKVWRKYSPDINITVFRLFKCGLQMTRTLCDELRDLPETETSLAARRKYNKKLIQSVTLFLMVQYCLTPDSHMLWVYSFLAYTFTVDVSTFLKDELSSRARIEGAEDDHDRQARAIRLLIQGAKVVFIVVILLYQILYISSLYVLITLAYFVLRQKYLEKSFTRCVESLQIDFFEGLEQFYVTGAMSFVEVLFALVFMVWSLTKHKQFLMLMALYTNVYAGGREIVENVVSAAFAEWTILAQFERATPLQLQELNDVCAICLSVMRTARKTPCNHYFHGHCLRRCLKTKSTCPMCSKRLGL